MTLKVRLVADAAVDPTEMVVRRAAEDLLLVLSEDHPDRVESVTREHDDDALWTEALANTRAEPGLQLTRHAVLDSELLMLSGESFFVATHALWAGELEPPESEHGTLVAVPNRSVLFAHPIRDSAAVRMLTPMLELARRFSAAGDGAINANLYWLRGAQQLERIALEETEDQILISPTSEFAQLLRRL
ncbi:hypothetical protein DVA67_023240 [Solirubrobacter sp. CPCC 204708]|uniref:Uncharacterized protein n=1 Tax=Solirubrobacter deserti TaxID=2282478 RepID=A0ABT4RV51_9ACTN|nr:hypothetical protein [Solirubrobacter deserti]MBE2318907.1 hypothetical protein [Solirubrobacter deserti]MDA0142411.1 hypothetical protein [Solirubrobacter deserti]